MTHSIISLGKGFTLDPCKGVVSPVGSVGASKGQWPFEVAAGDPPPSALLHRASWQTKICESLPAARPVFSVGHFDPLILLRVESGCHLGNLIFTVVGVTCYG